MKKPGYMLKLLLYISILVIGIVLGVTIRHLHKITISEEVNLIDMATLVVTVFLAVYIPAVLDRRLQSSQEKQELLIGRVSDYQALLRRINMLVQSIDKLTVNEYLTVDNLLDVCQNKMRILSSLMASSRLEVDFSAAIEEIVSLDNEHKKLLWSDKVKEDGFTYSDQIKKQEEELYNKLDEATSKLIFGISDAK